MTEALQKAHGLKTGAAEILACDFITVDRYCKRYPACQAVVDHWRKRRVDRAEYKLDEAIERGEAWAIALTLKTTGKDRGYVERTEQTGADGGPARVELIVKYADDQPNADAPAPAS